MSISSNFSFISPLDLRAPSADRCETLPQDRKSIGFYNPSPEILGPSPNISGAKTCKIRGGGAIWDNLDFDRE